MYKNNADELVCFDWFDHGLKAPNLICLRRHCVPSTAQSSDLKRRVEWSSHKNNESVKILPLAANRRSYFRKKYRHQMSSSAPSRGLGEGTGALPWPVFLAELTQVCQASAGGTSWPMWFKRPLVAAGDQEFPATGSCDQTSELCPLCVRNAALPTWNQVGCVSIEADFFSSLF